MSQFDDYGGPASRSTGKISAESFVATIAANVDNHNMTAEAFRELVRNTLPIVEYPGNAGTANRRPSTSQFDGPFPTR